MILPRFTADLLRPDDALLFDYDGTLADFVPDPAEAFVLPAVIEALGRLAARQPVAMVSGRYVHELDRFLHPLRLPASGAHGRQFRPHGAATVENASLSPLPRAVRDLATALAGAHPGARVEDKGEHAIGFHVRPIADSGARQAALDDFREAVLPLLDGSEYRLQPGNMVLEITPAACDKGRGVERLLALPDFAGRRAVYFGDDLTDEYAFAKLAELGAGLGVLVGPRALDPATQTAASYALPSPEAMRGVVGAIG